MDKERVKFYNRSDYFDSYMLNKALEKLRIFDFSKESNSLEEVLELYNIVKYIDDDAKSLVVNEEAKKLLSVETKKALMKIIGIFFNKIDNSNILNLKVNTITSVTIGNSVTSIGEWAFSDCSSLTSVTIGNSVTSIGSSAFGGCRSLTSVTIGNSVTSIGDYAFGGCRSLASVTIPDSVTSIGDSAFEDCSSLRSVTIPDSVKSISSSAFEYCSSLTSVTIGNSVTSIGSDAFRYCYKLIEVKNLSTLGITSGSERYGYIGYYAKRVYKERESYLSTDENGYIIYDDGTDKIIVAYTGTETDLTLPSGITQINQNAFSGCSSVTSVTIPDSVTSIGSSAFSGCSRLTSVTIPGSVTSIGSYAFCNCSSLTSVTIPDSVTSIGDGAFYNCSSLTSITFSDTSTWYVTNNYDNWQNKYDGTETSVKDSSQNATYFKSTYYNYYWYKL